MTVLFLGRVFLALGFSLFLVYHLMENFVLNQAHCEAASYWKELDQYLISIRQYYLKDPVFILSIEDQWLRTKEAEVSQLKLNSQALCSDPNQLLLALGRIYPVFEKHLESIRDQANQFQQESYRRLELSWREQQTWRPQFNADLEKVSFLCQQNSKFENLESYLGESCRNPAGSQSEVCDKQGAKIQAIQEQQSVLFVQNQKKMKLKWPLFSRFIDEQLNSCGTKLKYE